MGNSNVIEFENLENLKDALTEVIRVAARRAIAEAVQLELDEFLGECDGKLTESS